MANFIIVIIGLGSLIALHELGHLLAAKAAGMEVMEYSVGFGPALISKPVGRTVYSLRLIPLGGYVRIGGMLAPKATHEDGYIDEPGHENAFYRKSRTARLLVLASGCFMNLLTAVVIFSVLLYTNGIVPRTDAATMQHVQLSCLEAAGHAVKITGYMVGRIFEHLYLVVTGILPVPGVAGPIGLAKVAGERLAVSNVHFAFFLARSASSWQCSICSPCRYWTAAKYLAFWQRLC